MASHITEKQFCQLILTKPTVENVATVGQYHLTQPRLKGVTLLQQSELPILYGGGRDFMFGELETDRSDNQKLLASDLFVLNTCVIIWLKDWERSLQIPYANIIYHAIRKTNQDNQPFVDGHNLELVITVERDPIINELFPHTNRVSLNSNDFTMPEQTLSSVELILRPKYANYDRHYNEQPEDLFTFKEFGLNRGDTMVKNCYAAIETCMEFYSDDDSDKENINDNLNRAANTNKLSGIADLGQTKNIYQNTGIADDLDGDATMDLLAQNGSDAGMALQFYADYPLAGQKQTYQDEEDSTIKRTRN